MLQSLDQGWARSDRFLREQTIKRSSDLTFFRPFEQMIKCIFDLDDQGIKLSVGFCEVKMNNQSND